MPATNEWTLMLFFAGDNSLAPSMIPELKALKDAGFHPQTAVIARFDPSEKGTPTRIFDVNRGRKKSGRLRIGDSNDPFIHILKDDIVRKKDLKNPDGAVAKALDDGDTMKADEALESFLNYCREEQPANHYILFLVGHGLIVGNDTFLPDEAPSSGITLERLGVILNNFKKGDNGKELELLCMHSCSMSAVEVAYQLKGTAKYMLASEGITFVGSVPYRQLLKKTLNTVNRAQGGELSDDGIRELLKSLHFLTFFNSVDFGIAGFSADLCLSSLSEDKVNGLTEPLQNLVKALKEGLQAADAREKKRIKEIILLAHWKSQSYWQEAYTDLYDFCRCVAENCGADGLQGQIKEACGGVMSTLDMGRPLRSLQRFDDLVVYSTCYGPTYQYSHGLSVFFPWSRPIENKGEVEGIMEKYERYTFTTDLKEDSWLSFLKLYFDETRRESRKVEETTDKRIDVNDLTDLSGSADLFTDIQFDPFTSLDGGHGKINPATSKIAPADGGGEACTCPSIKNYPQKFFAFPPQPGAVGLDEDGE